MFTHDELKALRYVFAELAKQYGEDISGVLTRCGAFRFLPGESVVPLAMKLEGRIEALDEDKISARKRVADELDACFCDDGRGLPECEKCQTNRAILRVMDAAIEAERECKAVMAEFESPDVASQAASVAAELKAKTDAALERIKVGLPYMRIAAEDAKKEAGPDGEAQVGILSLGKDEPKGRIHCRFNAIEFFEDLALVLGIGPITEADRENDAFERIFGPTYHYADSKGANTQRRTQLGPGKPPE